MVRYHKAYVEADNSIDERNKPKVLLKAFEGLIASVEAAKAAIARKDYERKYRELSRIRLVIFMLESSLDMSYGSIPENLSSLYRYILRRIQEVNATMDVGVLDECKSILTVLHQAFSQAYELEKSKQDSKAVSTDLRTRITI